ncbi:MAG: sigma-54 factor interaction domain-containing protein, partial [Clostridiales bacterium]|nr:sigma-54 factor interaction domain-containing protein [Clostridiales bacterium]
VKSFDPPSRVCDVLLTKRAIRGISQRDDGSIFIVEALPIIQNEDLSGAILIAKDINAIEKVEDTQENYSDYQGEDYIEFIGNDSKITGLKEKINKIAKSDLAVLITGETGSGKELVARSIHACSYRSDAPFVAINCSALSANLIESELFGYDDGAFTGARKGGKAGLFEVANGGTLFLDEIGDMSLDFQPKLLRALEDFSIRRVGSNNKRSIDVRLIAATNKRIDELSAGKFFRRDLYYR